MSEVMWVWDYELKTLGSWPSTGYNGHNTPVEVVTQMDVKALRDERDRLANCLSEMVKLVDDFMPNVGRCTIQNYRRLNDAPIEARRLLAALTPAGGGKDEK